MLIFYVLLLSGISSVIAMDSTIHLPHWHGPIPHHVTNQPLGSESDMQLLGENPKLHEPLRCPKASSRLCIGYWVRVKFAHGAASWTQDQHLDDVLQFRVGGKDKAGTVTYSKFKRILEVGSELKIRRDAKTNPMLDVIHKDVPLGGLTKETFPVLEGLWGWAGGLTRRTTKFGSMPDDIIDIGYMISWWGVRFLEQADKQPYPQYPPIHIEMVQASYVLSNMEIEKWIDQNGELTSRAERSLDARLRLQKPAPLYRHAIYNLCNGYWVRLEPSDSKDVAFSWTQHKTLDDFLEFTAEANHVTSVTYRRVQRRLMGEDKLRIRYAGPSSPLPTFDNIDLNVSLEHLTQERLPQLKGYWGRAPDIMGTKSSARAPHEVICIEFNTVWTVRFVNQPPGSPSHFLKLAREYTLTKDEVKHWKASDPTPGEKRKQPAIAAAPQKKKQKDNRSSSGA